jgi:FMN phosphatase YigB (HAD superfamily)
MPNFKYQSVVFVDLDATILTGPFEPAVFPVILTELAQKTGLDKQEIRRLTIQENLDRQRDSNCAAVRAMDWDDIFNTIAEQLGVKVESKAVEIARAHAGPPDAAVLDGAVEALEQLASPQRALVVATKGLKKYQLPVLDALRLTPLFTDILTPDVNGALKNDIAFYGQWPASARLKISVGDHYEDDVIAPGRFGFRAIWKVNTPDAGLQELDPFDRPAHLSDSDGQTVRPDAIILSLRELPEVVGRLERR